MEDYYYKSEKTLLDFKPEKYNGDLFLKCEDFQNEMIQLRKSGQANYERQISTFCSSKVEVFDPSLQKNHPYLMFGSNSYLDITHDPRVICAGKDALDEFGAGTGSVSLLSGTTILHKKLEKELAEFHGVEDCVLFPSGYAANLGTISALLGPNDYVFCDKLNHASIINGVLFSRSKKIFFKHNDVFDLEKHLQKVPEESGKLIVVDSVFSMDGDIAPIPELIELCEKYKAKLMIDEAHSVGVIGNHGKGAADFFDVTGKIDLIMGCLSKSHGIIGGYVAGKKSTIDYLRFYAKTFFFSTSLPTHVVSMLSKIVELMQTEGNHKIENLHRLSSYFRKQLIDAGFTVKGSEFIPIVPVIIGNNDTMMEMNKTLNEKGIFVNGISYPAVSNSNTRLRFSVMSSHTLKDIDKVVEVMIELGRKYNII